MKKQLGNLKISKIILMQAPGNATDSTYETTIAGTYTVSNNVITYTADSGEAASYSFQFITFNRLKVDESEYVR